MQSQHGEALHPDRRLGAYKKSHRGKVLDGLEGWIGEQFFQHRGNADVVRQELYPSKEALDESFVGMEDAMPEQFERLDDLLATPGASV